MGRNREITVKGIGKLKFPVDFVEIQLTLEELDKNYTNGYQTFEDHILELQEIIQEIGLKKEDLKTSVINVYPQAVNDNGNIIFIDPQQGLVDVNSIFKRVRGNLNFIVKVDKLKFNENIKYYVANRSR